MPDIELMRLRKLRSRAQDLLSTLTSDLEPFQSKDKHYGFRRMPSSTPDRPDDVNVTTTCSCIMSLAHSRKVDDFYPKNLGPILPDIIVNVMKAEWQSSGLIENNAFTTVLVVRLCGAIIESGAMSSDQVLKLKKPWILDGKATASEQKTIPQICRYISEDINRFKINGYPPAAAVVYWFLDGVDHAQIDLKKGWAELCRFASEEFRRQRSYVVAKHTALMDPISMAMAACLCARLRSIGKQNPSVLKERERENLPSIIELESSIVDLFAEQTATGLWPKYFPLFHYDKAGSNFCYTFELLEAVLLEFGGKDNHILFQESVIIGLEKAVNSCEINRLESSGPRHGDEQQNLVSYNGWNSGGYFETLFLGQPESWATAVVHMFLRELIDILSRHIQQRLFKKYEAKTHHHKSKGVSGLLDIKVHIGIDEVSLKKILTTSLVKSFVPFTGDKSEGLLKTQVKKEPLSALLFGPPGTSKTEVAKAIAASLQWPLVEIDPSTFLQSSFQNIYVQAETIFKDVMDMYGAVVLFDELDALVQKRDGGTSADTESKFLTTYMLPKLAKLHDQGRLIFLMATNFQEDFDSAIKRAGRFDLLLCMGPPTLKEKCSSFGRFLGEGSETETGGKLLLKIAKSSRLIRDQLTLYTFGEFQTFLRHLGDANTIEKHIKRLGKEGLEEHIKLDSKSVGLRLSDLECLREKRFKGAWEPGKWKNLADLYSATFDEQKIKDAMNDVIPAAIKYIIERNQSKYQI
jgi:hypothetical protein